MLRSAGVVVIRFENKQPLFLLLRSWNFWDFPKGRVENNEDALETAIRETFEEASIEADELNFRWGTESYTTSPYKGHQGRKVGEYFIAETNREVLSLPVNPELGKPEHEEYKWVTYNEGQQLTNYRIGGVLKWAHKKVRGK